MDGLDATTGVGFFVGLLALIGAGMVLALILRRRNSSMDRPRTDEEHEELLQKELFE